MARYRIELPIAGRVIVEVDTAEAGVENTRAVAREYALAALGDTDLTLAALRDGWVEVMRLQALPDHRVAVTEVQGPGDVVEAQ